MKEKPINSGVSLPIDRRQKLNQLAKDLGVSRNQVFCLLIDAAEVAQPYQPGLLIIQSDKMPKKAESTATL